MWRTALRADDEGVRQVSNMKMKFEILSDRPRLTITLTRDSVCAADDFDAPHEKTLVIYSFIDPTHFIREISTGYLPSVAGTGHTWDCLLNNIHIGTISIDGIRTFVKQITYLQENHVYFRYNSSNS